MTIDSPSVHKRHAAAWILFLLGLVVVQSIVVFAQQSEITAKLRLAQSFELTGEWDRAASMYESLLEDNPGNFVILEGLRRSYTELKQYDKAMDLLRAQLKTRPMDENLLTTLGGLYDLAGRTHEADSLWHLVTDRNPANVNLYRLVAAQLIDHRQYERAIQYYLEGRQALHNDNIYVEELASLYGALHQYEAATHEYVRSIRNNPQQLTYVESRLSSFSGGIEGRRAAMEVVRREVNAHPGEVPMHSLLAWLLMEGKEYFGALEQYRIIDRLTNAHGNELFQFAQRAAQERAYSAAAKGFQEVLGQQRGANIVPYARFGYARAIEEMSNGSDSLQLTPESAEPLPALVEKPSLVAETQPSFQGALGLYESIIRDYPAMDITMQALYRIGMIRYKKFFDLDGAASAFDGVRRMPYNAQLSYEATLSLAEVETARNDLEGARREYNRLMSMAPGPSRERVIYRLSELDFFGARFDSAAAMLRRISVNASDDLTNDALQLLYFIQDNRGTGDAPLTEYATAELLTRQRKYSEALAHLHTIAAKYPATTLVDDATLKMGELDLLLNQTDSALAVFRSVADDMPASILRDRAQMRIAEVYERRLKDRPKAIEAYEQLLIKYPASLYVEEARKRIRILRGDAL